MKLGTDLGSEEKRYNQGLLIADIVLLSSIEFVTNFINSSNINWVLRMKLGKNRTMGIHKKVEPGYIIDIILLSTRIIAKLITRILMGYSA